MTHARDGCAVSTGPLSVFLHGYVGDDERAVGRLARETGLHKNQVGKLLGRARPTSRYTELRVADRLLAAIGHPEALHDGTLMIEPNPIASAAARANCCSGSLAPQFEPWSLTGA